MGDVLQKIVKIEEANFQEKFIKLKADGLTYRIWYVKKDNSLTKAGVDYETLPRQGVGATLDISYVEQEGEYQNKPITYRNIIGIKQATETHHENQHVPQRPESRGQRSTPQRQAPTDEKPDWNEINLGKCRHAYLLLAYQMNTTLTDAVVDVANRWAYASMYGRLQDERPEPDYAASQGKHHTNDDYQPPCPDDDIPF